ncbi:DUF1285 domain-containing protein [bacterium]|nr:DUF1285 domain-containing protein [bacterium]
MSSSIDQPGPGLSDLIARLQADAGLGKPRTLPPVHLWSPEHCGDIGLEIRKDGSWWQDGVRFTRDRLVRLFSTILRLDADGYHLVTPHEKVTVRVEDAPFVAIRVDRVTEDGESQIVFTTNVGDIVTLGPDHPLRVSLHPETGEPSVYVEVRRGLEARLARPPYYELVDLAEPVSEGGSLVVRSAGATFDLGEVE